MATKDEGMAKAAEVQRAVDAAQARAEAAIAAANALVEQKTTEQAELQTKFDAVQAAYDDLIANPQVPNELLEALGTSVNDLDTWIQAPSEPTPPIPQ